MPIKAMLALPTPTDDKEFEHMIRDFIKKVFGYAELYGRNGQKQYGIDVVAHESGELVGVQCKKYAETVLSSKSIDDIIDEAECFQPSINKLIIATTAKKDASVQTYIYDLSKTRVNEGKFPVMLIYWEEVSDFIRDTPEMLSKYYPQYDILQTHCNSPIIDAKQLKQLVAEEIIKYSVLDFLEEDPTVGIHSNRILEINLFELSMEQILKRSFICESKKSYKLIRNFYECLQAYSNFLMNVMRYTDSEYFVIVRFRESQEFEEVMNGIGKYRKNLYTHWIEIKKEILNG